MAKNGLHQVDFQCILHFTNTRVLQVNYLELERTKMRWEKEKVFILHKFQCNFSKTWAVMPKVSWKRWVLSKSFILKQCSVVDETERKGITQLYCSWLLYTLFRFSHFYYLNLQIPVLILLLSWGTTTHDSLFLYQFWFLCSEPHPHPNVCIKVVCTAIDQIPNI